MWLFIIGWLITMVVFVVAIDYTCGQINEVAQRVQGLESELRSSERNSLDLEMLSRELEGIHKTLEGGIAALLVKGNTANEDQPIVADEILSTGFDTLFSAVEQVEVAKLLWEPKQG